MNELSIRYLMSISEKHCTQGLLPEAGAPGHDIYLSQIRDWDARKGEMLVQDENTHPLLKVRALLFAGRFHQANDLLREMVTKTSSNNELAEFYLEGARLAAYEGQWQSTIDLANHALDLGPSAISALTLHQIRSVANFEMNALARALEDLDKIDEQCRLFPFSMSKVYGEVLRVRIQARDLGIRAARVKLDQLWAQLSASRRMNRDNVLALVRAEIDLHRMARKDHLNWTLASYVLANAMGDRLYAALALQDIFHAVDPKDRGAIDPRLLAETEQFGRVRLLKRELAGEVPASLSTSALQHWLDFPSHLPRTFAGLPADVRMIVISSQRIAVHVDPFQTKILPKHKQLFDAAQVLYEGPIVKDAFFARIWGTQKYAPAIHDILIRRVLYRLRKHMGANVTSERQVLKIHNALFI
ncbi:MAG: hypothetical protein ABL958_15240 [Bdellovibrionia bacterium]